MSRRRAHTLAELLIVLTILAILAVLVVPHLAGAALRSRMDAALSAVGNGMRFARDRAVATGLRHRFAVNPATGEVVVEVFHPEELDQQPGQGGQAGGMGPDVPLREQLHPSLRVIEWSVSPIGFGAPQLQARPGTVAETAAVVFYPEGTSDSALLVLESDSGERRGLALDAYTGVIRETTVGEGGR